ncbi:Rid family hydrolase [Promicromonospora aerolata]|uniref:Rid family hydrolase n=1 Tax=Promicromonospora aerolata TaxID=195749 RepID=A0ABW4VFV7_9MICO
MRGTVSADPIAQFEQLFTHLRDYLAVAGCDFASLVEITTYHGDLPSHLESFVAIKDRHVAKPYPAWSAIGISSLITPGALIELRAIAEAPEDDVERSVALDVAQRWEESTGSHGQAR